MSAKCHLLIGQRMFWLRNLSTKLNFFSPLNWYIGDALYPENVDSSGMSGGVMKVDKSLEELQRDSAKMHRIVGQDPYSISIHMNIRPKYNHLPPLCSEDVSGTNKNSSKLWHLPVATHSGRTDGHCLDEFLISSFVHNDLTLDLCNVVWDMVTNTKYKNDYFVDVMTVDILLNLIMNHFKEDCSGSCLYCNTTQYRSYFTNKFKKFNSYIRAWIVILEMRWKRETVPEPVYIPVSFSMLWVCTIHDSKNNLKSVQIV